MNESKVERYWKSFLATLPPDSVYHGRQYEAEGFGDSPSLADELGQLVLSGTKTGTCSAVWEYEFEGKPYPRVDSIWIVLDGHGEPMCITETTEITFRRYNEVDEEFARSEGEGDLSLQYWREAHKDFFSRTLPGIGREFVEDMPLVCERFKVIYK